MGIMAIMNKWVNWGWELGSDSLHLLTILNKRLFQFTSQFVHAAKYSGCQIQK